MGFYFCELIWHWLTLFFEDTTSSLLAWAASILANKPEVVTKMREEINNVLLDKEFPDFEDLKSFHYCRHVLQFTVEGIDVPIGVTDVFYELTIAY